MSEKYAEGTTIDKRLVIGLVLNSSFTLFEFLVGFFISCKIAPASIRTMRPRTVLAPPGTASGYRDLPKRSGIARRWVQRDMTGNPHHHEPREPKGGDCQGCREAGP